MRQQVLLTFLCKKVMESLQANVECDVVRIGDFSIETAQSILVHDACNQDEVALHHDVREPSQKFFATRQMAQEGEIASLLANVGLVKDDAVVAEVVELELLDRGNDLFTVVPLVEYA